MTVRMIITVESQVTPDSSSFLSRHDLGRSLEFGEMASKREKPLHSLIAGATAGGIEAYVN